MPTPEQRLDQLEPVISELLARQDETAAKVERVSAQVRQLTVAVTSVLTIQSTQSDNIVFLLDRTQQLAEGQAKLEQGQARLEQGQAKLEQEVAGLSQQMTQGFEQVMTLLNEKLK